ncbi:hypothetical protein BaRGS_00017925 [Batillaria attramentaria]|uniref:Glutamate-rich WD repeat-containing protein 1 n=1 Tax=Batillaria attramentaria TaxID=370345 RepID=A0ABD0KVG8_9CAEN
MADDKAEMEMVEEENDDSDDQEMEEEESNAEGEKKVYLPGSTADDDEDLIHNPTAYVMYHRAQAGAPCLSFDIVPDGLGDNREEFPMTCYLAAGTQAQQGQPNYVLHNGCVNRIRVTGLDNKVLAASWSDTGKVYIHDVSKQLEAADDPRAAANYDPNNKTCLQAISKHSTEGFAIDWSPTVKGRLATGDCDRFIHVFDPADSGWMNTGKQAYTAHTGSVEDIQWSPNENSVFASCSVDRTIRIWDVRAKPLNANMITVSDAHQSDVNVIHWNRNEPFIASGGDDSMIKIWDLRLIQSSGKPVASFKHHSKPITSIEWHPTDSSVLAASGADDQITIWDLAVEPEEGADEGLDVPPQLLFIHQGQSDIKEIHWHRQLPGVIVSTAHSDFNVFRSISV